MHQLRNTMLMLCLILITAGYSMAGEGDKKERRYFKLDPSLKADDYQAGSLLVKLKPEYRNIFSGVGAEANRVSNFFEDIQVKSARSMASPRAIAKANQRRAKPSSIDLSLYFEVKFSPDMSVEDAINEMYSLGIAEMVEPNYNYHSHQTPNDPDIDEQDYLAVIKAFEAWDITTGSEDIIIAIIDSGLDLDHPDLADAIYINQGEIPDNGIDDDEDGFIDNVLGWDFAGSDFENVVGDNDPQVTDQVDNSHGVRVAGCATAITDNEIGVASVGYKAKIMALKMAADNDDRDNGGGLILNSLQGVLYAANNGAHIINTSFGGSGRSQIAEDIYRYATFDQGALVVSSAGNANNNEDNFPANYPGVLSVAATDINDGKAGFSSFGNNVDISAPGVAIFTTTFNDGYTSTQGTSFSAPIVAGAGALVMALYPELSGFQVGEVLRVTADPIIYENLSRNFDNQMGLGRLDVEQALTKQLPSVRIDKVELLNAEGNVAQAGEDASLFIDFKNWLWPTSSNLEVTISTENRNVDIATATSRVGIIETEQVVNNRRAPFELSIRSSTPENTTVDILVEYRDGEYVDYEFYSILVNPTYLNLQENNVSTTFSNNGRIGYQDTDQEEGIGYIIEGTNMLFEMGLIMATSSTSIVSNVRTDNGEFDADFTSNNSISLNRPGSISSAEINGGFDDSGAGSGALGLDVNYQSMAWKNDADQDYVIVEYEITNTSESDLTDFYTALFADWDINQNNFQDFAAYNEATKTGYVYSGDANELRYAGIQVLNRDANYFAIDNDHDIEGNPLGIYDGFTDEEKFTAIQGGKDEAGFSSDGGTDVSHVVSAGPFNIAAGETEVVAFAIHGTGSFEALIASAQAADILYNQTLEAPVPTAESATVCFGDIASLTAAGATDFNWYTEISGGELLSSGATFETGTLFNDTTFYVSNADNSFESIRVPVQVALAANPAIQVNGATKLCEGDEVELTVANADSYAWSNGESTQSIVVNAAGEYTVTVTDAALGCNTTSEVVTIEVNPIPTAAFTSDKEAPGQGEAISFTDASTNAISWFWDFDDGNTSTEQNPTHTYTRAGDFEITLQVTNAEGCADLSTLSIEVVTGIDPDQLLQGISVYPNPAAEKLYITIDNDMLGDLELQVYTLTGELMSSQSLSKASQQMQTTLDLAGTEAGVYLVHVRQQDRLNIIKVIKQ